MNFSFKHIKLGNRIHKKIIPAKVRAHPPSERVNWKKKREWDGREKCFMTFLLKGAEFNIYLFGFA